MIFIRRLFLLLLPLLMAACQNAPQPGYTELPEVIARRDDICRKLLDLLPAEQRSAARAEAAWLAETAVAGAAAIARYNDPLLVNWLNNRTVNTRYHWRHRGLCWHYQHDMYRELRRRPLHYFRLGCCVRDAGTGREHHVVYIRSRHDAWPRAELLEVWRYAGRLQLLTDWQDDDWQDNPGMTSKLARIYPEGHKLPLEHWAMVRRSTRYNDYVFSHSLEARDTPQWLYMQEQMKKGLQERQGKAVDYQEIRNR